MYYRRSNEREERRNGSIAAQFAGGLEDAVEAPAGDAVDEEADENALEQQRWARLHRGSRHK